MSLKNQSSLDPLHELRQLGENMKNNDSSDEHTAIVLKGKLAVLFDTYTDSKTRELLYSVRDNIEKATCNRARPYSQSAAEAISFCLHQISS